MLGRSAAWCHARICAAVATWRKAALSAWREAAAARRVAFERQQVAHWLWARLEAVSSLASLRRHARSCARQQRALHLLLAMAVTRWRNHAAQRGACAAIVARAALEAARLAARRAWAQWRAAHVASLRCAWARLRYEGLRCDAAWRIWQAAAAARRLHSFWAAAVAAQGAAASLRGTVSRWHHAELQPLLACDLIASRSSGAAASVVCRAFGLWTRTAAAWSAAVAMATRVACAAALRRWQQQAWQHSPHLPAIVSGLQLLRGWRQLRRQAVTSRTAEALVLSTGRARGRLAALRTARAFGVWAGSAAAVNSWLRAAVARWARRQSWAFVQWAQRVTRWREARALLLQASVAHRRRAMVGAAVVWFGPTVRRRRVMACAFLWRGAAMVKALRCWREAASVAATAAAVTEVCIAAAARAGLALAWAELWQRARCAARAEAGWKAHVGRRGLRRWRAAAAILPITLRKRSGAVRSNAANAMRNDPATARRRWEAREAARAMLLWRAWTHEGRALALACARRAYARGYARHSPMKGVGPAPERRKEIQLAVSQLALGF